MKSKLTILLIILLVLVLATLSRAQTTHIANNNPGATPGTNVFTGGSALTDAIAAASAGDVIHVVRGSIDYGATTVDKQLTIYGIGLNPDTDGNERSIVSTVTIADPVASGTRISGLNITIGLSLGGTAGALNNLIIDNNRITRIQHVSASTSLGNVIIRNNVFGSGINTSEEIIDLLAGAIANVVIANNVIYQANDSGGNQGSVTASNGTRVENNLFVGNGNGGAHSFENFDGNSVKNNIFLGLNPSGWGTFSNNTFENNLSFGTTNPFATTNGNISTGNLEGQDPLITNVPITVSIDYSTFDPTLGGGSPAMGAGEDGTDMGLTGGGSPFDLSGSPLPLVQSILAPPTVAQGDDLNINLKGSGN